MTVAIVERCAIRKPRRCNLKAAAETYVCLGWEGRQVADAVQKIAPDREIQYE